MTHDMDLLRDTLASPEPSIDAVVRGRRGLQRVIRAHGSPDHRRRWWIAGGLTAATAASVAAAVVLAQPAPPVTRPRPGPGAVADHPAPAAQSVQQILFMAATSAQRAPAGSGTYWHVVTRANWNGTGGPTDAESWVTRDGQTWIRNLKTGAKPVKILPPSSGSGWLGPFFLGGQKLAFSQIESLPTDPTALTNWITTNAAQHGGKSGGPAPDADRQREDVLESLDSLLSQLPAPPAVRAAAFRALAALPGVTALGPRDGGQAIQFTLGGQQATLVVDPVTGQIRATNFFVTNDGALFMQSTVDVTITCEWTDVLP